MAIPFYENEEQHPENDEIDQVDGPMMHTTNNATQNNQGLNSAPADTSSQWENNQVNQVSVSQQDLMAWKILALAMCKALKDHYLQNMANPSSTASTIPTATTSSSSPESSTAVIQILPNGQVKPQWN